MAHRHRVESELGKLTLISRLLKVVRPSWATERFSDGEWTLGTEGLRSIPAEGRPEWT